MTNSTPPSARHSMGTKCFCFIVAIGSIFSCISAYGDNPDKVAKAKVSEGIKQFSSGNYKEAVDAFSAAAEMDPENSIIKFDKACALMATGEDNSARELLLQSALSKDTQVASTAYYNLACIAVKQGRASLGDNPLEADKKSRDQGIERLQAADAHFRDCLRIDPANKDARYNLELLRNFVSDLQSQWKRIDRRRELEQKDLFELLQHLDDQQAKLRQSVRLLSARAGGKVPRFERQRQAADQVAISQDTSLVERQIQQFLSAANPDQDQNQPISQPDDPSGASQLDESTKKIKDLLQKIVAQTNQDMKSAADNINAANWAAALQNQRSAIDHLREIYALLISLPQLIDREIALQESLLALHDSQPAKPQDQKSNSENQTAHGSAVGKSTATSDKAFQDPSKQSPVDDSPDGQSWQQNWITLFTQALAAKARSMLQAIPTADSNTQGDQPLSESTLLEESPRPVGEEPSKSASEPTTEQTKQLQQLRDALPRILEKTPEIIDLSKLASDQLSKKQFDSAKPNQLEVLRLLKELADSLPKQPPQDSKDKQQQNDQKNRNQDRNQKNNNQDKNQDKDKNQNENLDEKDNQDKKDNQNKSDQNSKDNKNQQNSDSNNSNQQQSDGKDQKNDQKNDSQDKNDSQEQNTSPKDQQNRDSESQNNNSDTEKQAEKDNNKPGNDEKQEKPEETKSGSRADETSADEKDKSKSASVVDNADDDESKERQAKRLAEERAQAILRRVREREAKYRELLQQLRELQGKRSPVDKDW